MSGAFGAPPPAPSGWVRLQPFMRTAVTGGAVVTLLLYGAQIVLPEGWRPSEITGDAAGDFERHETQRKMAAKVEIDRRVADAVAQANAKAQADVMAIQATLDERNKGLAGLSGAAAVADVVCLVGRGIAENSQPTLGVDWRRPNTDGDWHSFGTTAARTTCGLSAPLREEVIRSQLDAVRTATAARGMSMTNGVETSIAAQATQPAPLQAAQPPVQLVVSPRTVDEVYALASTANRYPWDEVKRTREYVKTLPQPVQDKLFAGTTDLPGRDWNLLVERTRAYVAVSAIK